jgi:FAD/FMN-containing dehydrogenase
MKLVTFFGANFAVRSGGHMSNPGFGSIGAEGVLFDVGGMNDIVVSADRSTVEVGPGATWDAIYEELEKHERTVVGGRVCQVGAAGLILGGNNMAYTLLMLACLQTKHPADSLFLHRWNVSLLQPLGPELRQRKELSGKAIQTVRKLDLCCSICLGIISYRLIINRSGCVGGLINCGGEW